MTILAATCRWGLQRPRLVAWACVWFLLCGALFVRDTPIDLLPNLAPASATIETEAPGLVAEQVEQTVTLPIESALIGAAGVAHVASRSTPGLSIITVQFDAGADPYRVRQSLVENLARAGALPQGVSPPRISPLSAAGADVLQVGFTSDKLDPMALRDLVQWVVRPRLLSAAGVARVTIHGGQIRRIEIRARPADLSDSDLGFLDILNAARRATSVAGAGFIDTPSQRVLIEPRGQARTIDEVGAGQIQTPGSAPVRIADVADVVEAPAPALGDALIMGKPGVILTIDRQIGANSLHATRAVERALEILRPSLAAPGVQMRTDLDRPASFTTEAVQGVLFDLLVGAALGAIALAIFMRDFRAVLISLLAIPLTLLTSVMALKALGWTLNAMTIGGLVVALGVVIDDAVIDVEDILARLRDAEARHASHVEAILAASLEVRGPVVFGSLALVVSLLPLFALRGPQGALLAPLAGAIIVASMASLVIALIVTPALALLFLRHIRPSPEPSAIARAKGAHVAWLKGAGERPRFVLLAALLVVLLAAFACFFFRSEFLPTVHDDHLVIEVNAPPSTSPQAMREMGARVAADITALGGVASVSERIGRDATGDDDGAGLEHAVFDVALAPGLGAAKQDAIAGRIRHRLGFYPGLDPLIRSRFDEDRSGGEAPAGFEVGVFGPDLDTVDEAAGHVAAVLAALPGAGDIRRPNDARAPVVRVDLNFPRLALFGLSAADVLDTIQAAFAGETVAKIYEGPRVIDLAVSAQAELRRDPEAVGNLLLRSTSGISVPLKSVANVYLTDGRAMIVHDGGLRRQMVAANPKAGGIDGFAAMARSAISRRVTLPPGVFLDFKTANSAQEARGSLATAYAVAIFAIFGLLSIAFDGRTAALILASTLFALPGAVVAVALTGGVFSLGATVGFISLFGISMRSAILMISRAEDLVLAREAPWSLATIARAARERAAPLVMTALLVVLAVAPLAVQSDGAGREILGPMAMVIIGGLASGTLANLLILPIMIFAFWRPAAGRRARALSAQGQGLVTGP